MIEEVGEIQRLWYEEEATYREIEKELGVSSKTIAKAIKRPEKFVEGYQREEPTARPVLGPYEGRIEELLKGKDWARGKRVKRTARYVYRRLRQEGYEGAESTVRAYIGERYRKPKAACPIEYRPGGEVQFDFGKDTVKIGDRVRVVHFMGGTFGYSTRRQLFAYPAERQECLFDGIERTYQRAGGVSERVTLDNTKAAVVKLLKGRNRKETEPYMAFRTMLGVEPRFTNRNSPWEKGHVEGTVGWAKRQVLMDLEVADWDELQKMLDEACEEDARSRRQGESGKLVSELYEEECQLMRPFPYEGRRSNKRLRAKVSTQGRITVEGARYSVPIRLRGKHVRVKLYWDEVVVFFEREEVARHKRDWSGRGQVYKVEHYFELLERSPALLDHGKPFTRMAEWLKATRETLREDSEFIELLLAVDKKEYSLEELQRASIEAMEAGCVTVATIKQRILIERGDEDLHLPALRGEECGRFSQYELQIESATMYDALLDMGEENEFHSDEASQEEGRLIKKEKGNGNYR